MFWDVLDRFVIPQKSVQNGLNWCTHYTNLCNEVMSECFVSNAPDLPHWTPNSYFRAFQTILLLHESRWKTGRIGASNAQGCAKMSCRNLLQRTHPIHPIGPQTLVLGRFRPLLYYTEVSAKWAELVQSMHKFVQRSRVGSFCKERARSTPLDPKLMFWGVSDCFITTRKLVQNGLNRCY
jgi:hypothetical protein